MLKDESRFWFGLLVIMLTSSVFFDKRKQLLKLYYEIMAKLGYDEDDFYWGIKDVKDLKDVEHILENYSLSEFTNDLFSGRNVQILLDIMDAENRQIKLF